MFLLCHPSVKCHPSWRYFVNGNQYICCRFLSQRDGSYLSNQPTLKRLIFYLWALSSECSKFLEQSLSHARIKPRSFLLQQTFRIQIQKETQWTMCQLCWSYNIFIVCSYWLLKYQLQILAYHCILVTCRYGFEWKRSSALQTWSKGYACSILLYTDNDSCTCCHPRVYTWCKYPW